MSEPLKSYSVSAASKADGTEVKLNLEARTAEEASERANGYGLLVSDVSEVVNEKGPEIPTYAYESTTIFSWLLTALGIVCLCLFAGWLIAGIYADKSFNEQYEAAAKAQLWATALMDFEVAGSFFFASIPLLVAGVVIRLLIDISIRVQNAQGEVARRRMSFREWDGNP